mgnify:CR=1 FL=1
MAPSLFQLNMLQKYDIFMKRLLLLCGKETSMKQKRLALGLSLSLALLCLVGCAPAQTAQPTASAAPSSAKDAGRDYLRNNGRNHRRYGFRQRRSHAVCQKPGGPRGLDPYLYHRGHDRATAGIACSHYGRSCLCGGRRHTVCLVAGRWRRAVGSQ